MTQSKQILENKIKNRAAWWGARFSFDYSVEV